MSNNPKEALRRIAELATQTFECPSDAHGAALVEIERLARDGCENIREELEGARECLAMVRERIEVLGHPMDNTPPYSYDDAISNLVFGRLKEAGAFPGHVATVRYERVEDEEEKYREVPVA